MNKAILKRLTCLLIAALLLSALVAPVRVSADEEEPAGELKVRLRSSEGELIPDYTVVIYRVADYSGEDITLTEDFASCGLTLNDIADGQKAADTSELLTAYLESFEEDAAPSPFMTAVSGEDGYVVFEKVPDGVYFMCGAPVEETEDEYAREVEFGSFIVALPTYDSTAEVFMRQVECKPKCEVKHLLGDLIITKELLSYEPSSSATFVFSITATKEDKDGNVETVYSNYVSMTFTGAGYQEYRIENAIPVGASVTVTEVYSGTSYTIVGSATQTATILLKKDENSETAKVGFVNDYDRRSGGGGSHLNEFTYDEGSGVWTWAEK